MLGRFLKKDSKPSLPKHQIEVICPVCGAAQIEPRLVVTTFCKKCGEHLRIEKLKAIASAHINPVPSAVYPASGGPSATPPKSKADSEPTPAPAPTPTTPPAAAPVPSESQADFSALLPKAAGPVEELPPALGLGNMMGFKESEDESKKSGSTALPGQAGIRRISPLSKIAASPTPSAPPTPMPPTAAVEPETAQEPIATPAKKTFPPEPPPVAPAPPTASSSSTFQKMRQQGFNQQYFKEAECFDCHHKFKVGRSAKSTQCPTCGAQISLEDLDINQASSAPIRTRGDVQIRKTGNVNTTEIKCRDLRMYGMVNAAIECTGDLIMRTSGSIVGEIRCHRIIVEKGSDISFVNTILADEVEIHARVTGNIRCNGPVFIASTGWVHGDVSARAVSIEPGGQLDGAMNIIRAVPTPKPGPNLGGGMNPSSK